MKVSKRLLEMIQCIFCGNDFSLEGGVLKCGRCSAEFKIVDGIPSFIESLPTENEFKQAEFYNGKATALGAKFKQYYFSRKQQKERQVVKAFNIIGIPLDDMRGKRIIQMGCGEALQCELLAKAGGICVGLDISFGMLQLGIRYADWLNFPIDFIHSTAENKLPFKDRIFDINFGMAFLNHINYLNWVEVITERKRVTKPGGIIFDVLPHLLKFVTHCHYP